MNNKINFTILTKQDKTLKWSFEEIETKRDDYGNKYYIQYTMPSGDVFLIDCRYIKEYDFRKICVDFLLNFYGDRLDELSEDEEKEQINKTIEVYVLNSNSWCANDIMYLYAKNTKGVEFERDKYMHVILTIKGKRYQCIKWSIHPDKDNEDYEKVTIYLEEVKQ